MLAPSATVPARRRATLAMAVAAGGGMSREEPGSPEGVRLQRLDSMDRRIRAATGPATAAHRRAAHRRTPSSFSRDAARRMQVEFAEGGPLGVEFAWPFVAIVRPGGPAARAGVAAIANTTF